MDFALEAYARLLDSLSGYELATVEEFLGGSPKEPFCILRHDVDRFPDRAARMARLEKRMRVRSTYYFRWIPGLDPAEAGATGVDDGGFPAKEIIECRLYGHEVGYHYENLSALASEKRNRRAGAEKLRPPALEDFEAKLELLRKLAPVSTVAMHGSPTSRVDNADLLRSVDLTKYGLLGDPHISAKFDDVVYITDTGRRWSSGESSIRDRLGKPLGEKVKGTEHLCEIMRSGKHKRVMINTHPQRWAHTRAEWASEMVGQNVRNVGKVILRARR